MRRCITCIAFAAAMASMPALGTDREEPMPQEYRAGPQVRLPSTGNALRFRAPPSQLREPWRCDAGDVYARPSPHWHCLYNPRLESYILPNDGFVTLRLLPPMRPLLPPLHPPSLLQPPPPLPKDAESIFHPGEHHD